jgi:mRNA interferase HigB
MIPMRIIALSTLKGFWETNPGHADIREPCLAWYSFAKAAHWASPMEIKQDFATASILKDGRVVYNLAGNKYRLVVWINYSYQVIYVRFIGTHKQYDAIDAQTI